MNRFEHFGMQNWSDERSNFSHIDLPGYITKIDAVINICHGKVIGKNAGESVKELCDIWPSYLATAQFLIENCEVEMSPRRLFSHSPLRKLDPILKAELENIAHELWLKRNRIEELMHNVDLCINAVNNAANILINKISQEDEEYTNDLILLRQACFDLSNAISNLPKTVMV